MLKKSKSQPSQKSPSQKPLALENLDPLSLEASSAEVSSKAQNYIQVVLNLPIDKTFTYSYSSPLTIGQLVQVPFGEKILKALVVGFQKPEKTSYRIRPIYKVFKGPPIVGIYTLALAQKIKNFYFCSWGEALFHMLPTTQMQKKIPLFPWPSNSFSLDQLNESQQTIYTHLLQEKRSICFLQGSTGSGKTHLCLQLCQTWLKENKQVLYLVPEISLATQFYHQLKNLFPQSILLYHSQLKGSEKIQVWNQVKNSCPTLVIGVRSALFLPFHNLKTIIMDEEHAQSYKSGQKPYYHARQVAFFLSKLSGASILLCSATPSLESYKLIQEKKIKCFHLESPQSSPLLFHILDQRQKSSLILPELLERIYQIKAQGKQSLLLLNRKGFSHWICCPSCHKEITCQHCCLRLTYYKNKNQLICHYCGYSQEPTSICPHCHQAHLVAYGVGSEFAQDKIQKLLPSFKIARLDAQISSEQERQNIILDFMKGHYDILIGTQMIAKGFNFPNVALVGVLNADIGINWPDFRALEFTYSLLKQVAGRTGRYDRPGEVWIQTKQPFNPCIALLNKPLDFFYQQELQVRQLTHWPPFSRLIRIIYKSPEQAMAQQRLMQFKNDLSLFCQNHFSTLMPTTEPSALEQSIAVTPFPWGEILGPVPCPFSFLNNQYRYHLVIRTDDLKKTLPLVYHTLKMNKSYAHWNLQIDVDPITML